MVQINFALREVNCKIVYYGPGLSGKTTNLEMIYQKVPADHRGDLTSIATEGDRTLFFDFMPLDLGKVAGMTTRLQLYTVPGQVYYNATRKLVLQGADGIVFVADSQQDKMQENIESLNNLEENLKSHGVQLSKTPCVMQYNKCDLPNVTPVEELETKLNKHKWPCFECVAITGEGIFPTLKKLAGMVLENLNREYGVRRPAVAAPPRRELAVSVAAGPVSPPPAQPPPPPVSPAAPPTPAPAAAAPGPRPAEPVAPKPPVSLPPQPRVAEPVAPKPPVSPPPQPRVAEPVAAKPPVSPPPSPAARPPSPPVSPHPKPPEPVPRPTPLITREPEPSLTGAPRPAYSPKVWVPEVKPKPAAPSPIQKERITPRVVPAAKPVPRKMEIPKKAKRADSVHFAIFLLIAGIIAGIAVEYLLKVVEKLVALW